MPEKFLSELTVRPFPQTVKGQRELKLVQEWRKSGYILALTFDLHRRDGYARVLAVTPSGREALAMASRTNGAASNDSLIENKRSDSI